MTNVTQTLSGRHLFVTGATGFVGKVWLSHLLGHVPDIGRITLLVRGDRTRTAAQRMADILATSPAMRPLKERLGTAYAAFIEARVEVVEGDVTLPGLGLDGDTRESLAASVDATVHFAGLTDFQPDPRRGVPANVRGAMHLADVVAGFRSPVLLHTSTCFVAGMAEGDVAERLEIGRSPLGRRFDPVAELEALEAIVRDENDPGVRIERADARAKHLGWPNLYTFTKGLAEHLLAARGDLRLAITRPSVVECARTWPFAGWNEGLNTAAPILWYCGTAFPELPAEDAHLFDVVPVDAVARWTSLALATLLCGTGEGVWQFASSDVNPVTFGRIIELSALERRRHARRPGATLRDRLEAQIDVRGTRWGDLLPVHPEAVAAGVGDVVDALRHVEARSHWPRGTRWLADAVAPTLSGWRKRATKARRSFHQLGKMLEVYRPFLHDHSWVFHTERIRAATAQLGADDGAFVDDVGTMDWRRYWMDVQLPGVRRWSFPIMEGDVVADDPPCQPALTLNGPRAQQGAA
jgi:long-chain acyl-CoA synthetase